MPSNYNTRFFFRFDTDAHREMRINIQQRGYTGTAVQRPLGEGAAVLKRDSGNNGIFGTSLEIIAECNSDDEYAVLYTSDPREFYVELIDVDRNVTLWDGFVSPELYSAPEVYPPYDVRIIAVDGLGELKRDNFANPGRTSILNHLISILSHSGLQTNASNILVIDSLSCQTPYVPGASLLSSIQVDLGNLTDQEMTCYEALEAILATLNLTITRYGSKWLLIRESDVVVEAGTITAKTAAGETVVLPVIDYGSAANHDWWPVGRVENEVVPARNRVSVSLAYARRTMLENADLVNGSGWIYPTRDDSQLAYVEWQQLADGMRPHLVIADNNASVTIRQEIPVHQYSGKLTLRIQTLMYYNRLPRYPVYFRLAVSDGTALRFLKYHENGNYCEWVSQSIENKYEEQIAAGYVNNASSVPLSAFSSKEIEIPGIPLSGTLGIFITAKPTYALASNDFFLGGVYLSQDAVPGYKDTIVIDNGARGSAGDAVSVFGDAPYTPNGLKNVLNITADGNGVITTDWQTSKFGGELLSVIAMDRALGVALPRLLSKGVLNVPGNAGLPAVIVNPDGIPMLIQRSSWKLLDDEVEVEILSVPAGSVEITSESIVPMSEDQAEAITGGTAGTSGGGGAPSTPVPEEKLFEAIYGNGGITGAKALYDIFIKQVEADEEQQIEEQLKNATEILKHLFLVPNDGRPYIRSDIGFVSEDFVSGAGLSTTQGGAGGGGSIATLSDVSLSGLANGNILRYDASVGMWRNESLNLGTAASYNIGIVAQGDNGLVTGGAVYDAINTILSSAVKFVGITTTALTDGSTTSTVTIDGASHTAQRGDVVIYGGKEFLWTGSLWQQMGDEASWALKTVTITGAGYLTGGGTLEANRTLDIASTYKTHIQNGQTAYGWGNHATAGYALADNLTTLAGRVTTLEGRTDWDEYLEIDDNGDIHVKGNRGLWSDSFLSGAGLSSSSSGGGSGVDLDAMWGSLTNSVTDAYANTPIALAHIPDINTSKITNLESWILGKGYASASDLSGYLPLTGGTLTGPLTVGSTLTVSGLTTFGSYVDFPNASANYIRATQATGSFRFVVGGSANSDYAVQITANKLVALTSSLSVASNIFTGGFFYARTGDFRLYVRDTVTTESGVDKNAFWFRNINGTNNLYIGYETCATAPTYIYGNHQGFYTYNGGNNLAMYMSSAGNVGIATMQPAYKLDVAGDIRARNRLYIGTGSAYIEVDSDGYLHTASGFYSDSFVSGGGLSTTSGSGGGGVDLAAMWNSLTNSVTDAYANTPIALAHIPDITTAKISNLDSWLSSQGYVSNVSISGENLRVTKSNAYTDLTIPFATTNKRLKAYPGTASAGGYDLNTLLTGGGITSNYGSMRYWGNGPSGAGYGAAVQIATGRANSSLDMQLLWDIDNDAATPTRRMWWRAANSLGWSSDWHLIYDSSTLTKSVLTDIIGATTYAPYNAGGYLPLAGGTLTGPLTVGSTLTVSGLTTFGSYVDFPNASANYIRATQATGSFRFVVGGSANSDYAVQITANKLVALTSSLSVASNIFTGGFFYARTGDFRLYVRDTVTTESGVDKNAFWFRNINGTNNLYIGYETCATAPTYIYGNHQGFYTYNGGNNLAMYMSSAGNVGIATMQPAYKLDVAGDIRARNRLYIGTGSAYIEVDSDGYLHTASGFYSDSFVSGGGLSTTSGSGGGGVDLAAMWNSLTNSVTDAYANTPIALAHIPDITTAKISNLEDWISGKGYATASSIPSVLPNPYSLTFGSKTYDGSAARTITASDLGALTSVSVVNNDATLSRNSHVTIGVVQGIPIRVYTASFALTSEIPVELPNPSALSFGNKTYDGSAARTITASDLGALTSVSVSNYDATLSRNQHVTIARVQGTDIQAYVPSFALVSEIPSTLPNPYALTFGSKTYDGSVARSITASDFGLGSAASDINTLFSYFNGYGAANEAVQLTTTRTIWGQEFDGTQNVSGAISGATTGAFSSWVQASYYYVGSSATAYLDYRNNMLHANVGFYADGPLSGAGLSTTSDARMKTDITGISFEKARSVIAELRPVTFRWRADGTLSAGFVAQEVAPFLPDAVTEVGGTLRLKYDQIFTYGMAVLSGLLGKTESIERRVHRLEGEVQSLREENNRLRARINA